MRMLAHHRRLLTRVWLLLAGLLILVLGLQSSMAHDTGSPPHQGHPPLHATDIMKAFKDDHHDPQVLPAMPSTPCVGGFAGSYPCNNIDLLAFMPLNTIGGGSGNDIWGWTDPLDGKEYAIMGRTNGTSFVDISDPENPVYLGNLPPHMQNSSWRDIKVYNNHAYIVTEAFNSGMQVFDLTRLRSVVSPPVTFNHDFRYSQFGTAHNIVINEDSGYAYAVGANSCSGGLHMIDISSPPSASFAGCYSTDGYTHDAQCVIYNGPDTQHQGKEICFNSNEDTLTIVDVTNKSAPSLISRTGYAGVEYTHQGWLTEDQVYFLLDDELDESNHAHNTRTYIWNVSDLDNPSNFSSYTASTAAIDHNQYVKGNYTYQSNYRAGLRILDISDIANGNLSEAAFFDVYPANDSANFNGTWSNYPYFDSGVVVVSGIEQGLFILQPNLGPPPEEPTVSIASPAEGSTVAGTVTIAIDASDAQDPAGTLTVEWNVDGGAWQSASYNGGSQQYEDSWDTTTTSDGPHTINARVTDSDTNVAVDSNNVTVTNSAPEFHVDSIEVTSVQVRGQRYRGEATVTIVDAGGSPVSGVLVNGSFTGDSSGSDSDTTNASGQAFFQSPNAQSGSNWTFCVDSATKSGWIYDAAANVEDCDSTGGATPTGTIAGQVVDADTLLPISGATVSTDSGQSDTTDASGNYSIADVPTGSRTVTASASGYDSAQDTTTVNESATSTVDFSLTPSAGGGSGTLKGTVTNIFGNKVSNAIVQTDTGESATTNRAGKYTIQNVPAGSRIVTVTATGYATQQQTTTINDGQTTTLDFTLSP